MTVTVVVGTQWGDEGKGKIVDLLSQNTDIVARYQGGSNAGHTIINNGVKCVLHLIPSGILHKQNICLLGNGMVIDPFELKKEIEMLESMNVPNVRQRIRISENAHVVTEYHKMIDAGQEKSKTNKVGTTGRGIGSAYSNKIDRIGIRMGDFKNPEYLKEKLEYIYKSQFEEILRCEIFVSTVMDLMKDFDEIRSLIIPMLVDGVEFINDKINMNKKILVEGAQGLMLDIDHGTYPYVTSSSITTGGVCSGLGIAHNKIDKVIGVVKAYTTRVGNGPFPTEFNDDEQNVGEQIRTTGKEFGATTGRPRRCGWFDAVVVRKAIQLCGIDEVVLTKLDVLDEIDSINVCHEYFINGNYYRRFPTYLNPEANIVCGYNKSIGWKKDTTQCTSFSDLPEKAKCYVERLEVLLKVPISMVSVGADRNAVFETR